MADKFTPATRRGGTTGELRKSAVVATNDGVRNDAGAGRGFSHPPMAQPQTSSAAEYGNEGYKKSRPWPPEVDPNSTNYSHENRRGVAPDSKDPMKLNFDFQSNILDNFDTATYHWKLFITTQDASSTGKVFDAASQIIIAESGVSDLTIDNVRIQTLTTPSTISGTGTLTEIKFEILEPVGANLLDQIYYQAIALGNPNWNVMPFYLQLQFKSRDPDTSEVANTDPGGDLSSLRWLWVMRMTSISANVTHVGTRYEVTALPYNEHALGNTTATLQHPIVLSNLSTFGDAMSKLESELNIDEIYKLIGRKSIPDTYRIVVDPAIAQQLLTPIDNNANSTRSGNPETLDRKDATFAAGTAIDKIIDSLLSHTKKYQEGMTGESAPGAPPNGNTQASSALKPFWRIIPECRPIKYDPLRQTLANDITYYIVEYNVGLLPVPTSSSIDPSSIEGQRRRLADYAAKNVIKKKYNYIFTGLNDQVIDFDLTINNAFAVAQARMQGVYNNTAMYDKGIVNQENAKNEADVAKKLSQTIALMNDTMHTPTSVKESAIASTQEAINAADLPDETKIRYTRILEGAKPANRLNFTREVQASGGISAQTDLEKARLNAKFLSTPREDKVSATNYRFISDVNITGSETLAAYAEYVASLRGQLRPIARVDSMQQRQVGMGLEANSNSALQNLNSIYAVALHSGNGTDVTFAQSKIKIKGDPFWLYPQPTINNSNLGIEYNSLKPNDAEALSGIKRVGGFGVGIGGKMDSINIYTADSFLLLRFRTPKIYDIADPGSDDAYTDVEAFSGIFRVIKVSHTFVAGKFVQELDLQLDTEINVVNFTKQFDEIQSQGDKPSSTSNILESGRLLDTTSKTQRVISKDIIKGEGNIQPSIASIGPKLSSNTPVAVNSIIAGLPPTYG